jgi:hypothetical protein
MRKLGMRDLGVLAVAASLFLILLYLRDNRQAIAQAKAAAVALQTERDSLVTVVWEREQQQAALALEKDSVAALANTLVDSVGVLERRRAAAQRTVRQIRTTGALQARLRSAFPELGDSAWGLTTVPLDHRDSIGIEYLMVPAWFAETFVIDHANAASWRAQKDQLLAVDSLRLVVTVLQDSITRLVAANAEAYAAGYQAAYAGYQDLTQRYVAELQKPRIRLGSVIGLLGAVGVGVVVGRVVP